MQIGTTSKNSTLLLGGSSTAHLNLGGLADFTLTDKSNLDKNTQQRHSHENKEILDNTTASYTTDDKTLLYLLQTQMVQAISPENLINISYLFSDGTNEDLRQRLDTSYAIVMDYTFRRHIADILSVRTDSAESMQHCFENASASEIELKCKDSTQGGTPKLIYANHIFKGCASLAKLTGLDCTNVTTLKYAFYGCTSLETATLVSTAKVTDLSYAFYNSGIAEITGLDISSVKNLDGAFAKSKVTALTLDCSKVTSAKGTFTGCTALTTLTLSNITDSGILSALFTSLPAVETGTITLENCENAVTDEIKTTATEKGWTVA